MNRHNETHDGVAELAGKAFTPSYLCNVPLIHPGRAICEVKAQELGSLPNNQLASKETYNQKLDMMIC